MTDNRATPATRRSAFVVFNNDSPELVFDDDGAAEREAKARQDKALVDARDRREYPRAYWHVHEVPRATPTQLRSEVTDEQAERFYLEVFEDEYAPSVTTVKAALQAFLKGSSTPEVVTPEAHGDCDSRSPLLGNGVNSFVCELDAGHDGPHRAFTQAPEYRQPVWDDTGVVADPRGDFVSRHKSTGQGPSDA